MSNGKKRLGGLALAFAAVMAVFAAAGPALADDDGGRRWNGDREWRWDGGGGGSWRHDMEGWRDNGRRNDGWQRDGWRNNWRNDGWRNDGWRWGNNWRNDGRWGHNWGPGWGNNWRRQYPNFVYVYPQPQYYHRPRPYYQDYYARPSFNFVIPLDLD